MTRHRTIRILFYALFLSWSCCGLTASLLAQSKSEEGGAPEQGHKKSATPWASTLARGIDLNFEAIVWKQREEGFALAKKQKKPVLLLRYASWCPACKDFAKLFHEKEIVTLSKQFVMVLVDVDEPDAGDGYGGNTIPELTFHSAEGTLLPVTATDSSEGESPYFYVLAATLRSRMKLVTTTRDGRAPRFEKLKTTFDNAQWRDIVVADSSMLPACGGDGWTWDDLSNTYWCDAWREREDITARIQVDEGYRLTQFVIKHAIEEYNATYMREQAIPGMITWFKSNQCEALELSPPASLSQKGRERLESMVSQWRCEDFRYIIHHVPDAFLQVLAERHSSKSTYLDEVYAREVSREAFYKPRE